MYRRKKSPHRPPPDPKVATEEVVETASPSGVTGAEGTSGASTVSPPHDADSPQASLTPDRTRSAIEHVQAKIVRTRQLIKSEQTARDDNVNEYLKLSVNADRNALQRIKTVFEKKNQKSAQTIAQLQKRLDQYVKRKREYELNGAQGHPWQPRVLQNVGKGISGVVGNITEGLSVLGSGGHTSSENNKIGSDDDSSSFTSESSQQQIANLTSGSSHLPETIAASATSNSPNHRMWNMRDTSETMTACNNLEPILQVLNERRDECQRLQEEIDAVKSQLMNEVHILTQALAEERDRCEHLQVQLNDLSELHQNEVENLKQTQLDMEEKITYQSEERLRDISDMLENVQTRISRMEHQQNQHLQQLVLLDSIDNSQARAVGLKFVNVILMLLQLVLLLAWTTASVVMPFLQSRLRIISTLVLIISVIFVINRWPDVFSNAKHRVLNLFS